MKNYSNASRARFEPIRIIEGTSISADLVAFGAPYNNPARIIDISNDTDQPVVISFDGINENVYCPAHSGRVYDFGSNRQANSDQFDQPKETQLYVASFDADPSLGNVVVGIIYASND